MSKHVTWEDLAVEYNKCHSGRSAQTLPFDTVFAWAESRTDLFILTKDGYLVRV